MNKNYKSVWNAVTRSWVAVSELARGRGKTSVRRSGRSVLRTLALVVLSQGMASAYAGYYTVATPQELAAAINQANVDGDSYTTIELSQDIMVHVGAAFDAVTNPVTLQLDTSGFALRFQGVAAAVNNTGSYNYFEIIGVAGSLALAVSDGAVLKTAGNMFISVGGLAIDGGGSALAVADDLVFGRGGDVSVQLSNGGRITTGRTFLGEQLGNTLADHVTATVDGPGTVWEAASYFNIAGAIGSADVTVSNGGSIRVLAPNGMVDIGRMARGTLLVTGAGSSLVLGAGGRLAIGSAFGTPGDGLLTIRDGGLVVAPSVQMATLDAASRGTLVVDSGGTLETAALSKAEGTASVTFDNGILRASAAGTLISGFVPGSFDLAAGGMRLDSNGFDVTVASTLSGVGGVTKQGAGTLTLSTGNSYAGTTNVVRGRLLAGVTNAFSAASAHVVASGATLDTGGLNQRVAGLDNSGTVSLFGNAVGSTLTTTANYVGRGGLLQLGTMLGGTGSISDRLVLDGAGVTASGNTSVQVTALGGLGALTVGNGIEVISGINGATTTAQTTKDAFSLAGGHIDAGAYEYRLYAADANGAGENWYLRSTSTAAPVPAPAPAPAPAPQALPTYRIEVPAFAALPEQLREANLAMLGNLHQRVGDDAGRGDAGQRRAWGRVISMDRKISQSGDASPSSEGRLTGFQAGIDLWASANWRAGIYVGQLDGDMRVNGFVSGIANAAVGSNDLRNQSFGVYGTYTSDGGFYADAVLQAGRHRYDVQPIGRGAINDNKAHSRLASLEVGQSWPIAPNWRVEPQLQLVYQSLDLQDTQIPNALVQYNTDNSWTARLGMRIKGEMSTSLGSAQPYARFNLYRRSTGTDITRFIGPDGSADIATKTGGTSSELATGVTLQMSRSTSLYGEVGKLWAAGGGARTRSGINGSVGLQVRW